MTGSGAAGFVEHQRINRRATFVVLAGTFLLLALVANVLAFALGGYSESVCTRAPGSYPGAQSCETAFTVRPSLLVGVLVAVGVYLLVAYLLSPRAALALNGARPASETQYRQLHEAVAQMSLAAGIPPPRVYVVDDPAPNAFATGRRPQDAAVTVTTGLLQQLSPRELRGVVAHELAHIKNRDIAISTLAVLAVGLTALLAQVAIRAGLLGGRGRSGQVGVVLLLVGVAMYLLAVPAGMLLKAALSRRREALADASAIEFTREPYGLRAALEKLEADTTVISKAPAAAAHLWIESPLERGAKEGLVGSVGRLFNTHPPLAERIALLRGYEGLDPTGRGPVDPYPVPAESHRQQPRETVVPPPAPTPGWYQDHADPALLRWWDGSQWSSHTHHPGG